MAYADWAVSGLVVAFDRRTRQRLPILKRLARMLPPLDAICVAFLRSSQEPSLVELLLHETETDAAFVNEDWGGTYTMMSGINVGIRLFSDLNYYCDALSAVNLYYEIVELELRSVVDLRDPSTQEAFHSAFHRGCSRHAGQEGFLLCILPALMNPAPGGSLVTDLIGSYLRTFGVDALIYPSARFNVSVGFWRDELVNYRGWNLVDYRDTTCSHLPSFNDELFRFEQSNLIAVEYQCPAAPSTGRAVAHGGSAAQ
jgi:hypothetical protein